jgi:hypothetical protein
MQTSENNWRPQAGKKVLVNPVPRATHQGGVAQTDGVRPERPDNVKQYGGGRNPR